ncbi:Cof-type HAD-IIB family hydrolase [Paenibacillus aceti]|uniref:Sugar phosphate phosphatase n=1 Tax=Paenibacillus aceti TaxID=1820010 RepID=A0ABQ1VS79_9BACL|nr:Cof-type HAD-IIB family hydrolase [Paenibacillus aceti]GGF91472.1 sugar phosphate phosphatase [Paenibacillus aceti]
MKYKLIALDVDGTLLTDDHVLTPGTIEVIKQIAEQGTEFVLCTGRAPLSCIPYMEQMGLDDYAITHNGAATISVKDGSVIHDFSLRSEGLERYIHYCEERNLHYDLNTTFRLYVKGAAGLSREALDMYRKFLIEPKDLTERPADDPFVKMTVSGDTPLMDQVMEEWNTWTHEFNVLRSGDYFIDLMHKDSSKGSALSNLAEIRGIPAENVLAIGNYYNDLTMLEFAGLGIAMDNSPQEVKDVADVMTASNNEEGVKLALQKYCL